MIEASMAVYSVVGLCYLLWNGIWAAVGFQTLFSMSYIFVTRYNIIELLDRT